MFRASDKAYISKKELELYQKARQEKEEDKKIPVVDEAELSAEEVDSDELGDDITQPKQKGASTQEKKKKRKAPRSMKQIIKDIKAEASQPSLDDPAQQKQYVEQQLTAEGVPQPVIDAMLSNIGSIQS